MLEIKEAFTIRGRGIMVVPALPSPIPSLFKPFSERVVVQRPDGVNTELNASFHVEHFSLVGGSGIFGIVALFPTASLEDFSSGSRLLISETAEATIYAAIHP